MACSKKIAISPFEELYIFNNCFTPVEIPGSPLTLQIFEAPYSEFSHDLCGNSIVTNIDAVEI